MTEEYYQNDELVYSKEYTYDDAGRLIDNGYDIYYMYDERGRVITEFQGDHIIDYSYDDRGRKSERILWADGQYDVSTTTYTYDLMSRLTEVSNSSMPTATQNTYYTYTPNGQILTETTGGLVTSYEYNNAGLVTKKTNKVGDVEPGSVYGGVSDFSTHTYYTNGNMMSKFSQADLCDTSYTYDGAGRLTLEFFQSSGSDYQTIYQYDASGNRSRQTYIFDPYNETNDLFTTVTEYTYDANNRLTSVTTGTDTLSYTYDNNGNMLSESNGKTYSYNALNQLVSFYDGEEYTTTYTYLSNGLRASKTSGNDNNHLHSDFAWDGDALLYEYEATNTSTPSPYICTVYNYGHGLISHSDNLNGNYILYAKNAHGDIIDLLDAADELGTLEQNQFDAFGNGGSTGYSAMGYAGQYHDYETGFIYLRARYYNPAIGRFINEDPIRDGLNWYVYCNNNPVNRWDFSGLFDEGDMLSYGMTGDDVLALQTALMDAGYLDCVFSKGELDYATLCAVNRYKVDHGLDGMDVVDLQTWTSLGLIYRTQADIDAGVQIVTDNGYQYFDVTVPINNLLKEYSNVGKNNKRNILLFYYLVNHGQKLDIKRDNVWETTLGITYPGFTGTVVYGNWYLTPEMLGNYVYGYVGIAFGFCEGILYLGSMYAAGLISQALNDNVNPKDWENEMRDWVYINLGIEAASRGR